LLFKAADTLSPTNGECFRQAYQNFDNGKKNSSELGTRRDWSSTNRQLFQFNKQAVSKSYKCGSERTSDKKKKKSSGP